VKEKELKACVSGSFSKFKPEIDLAIEELKDLGVVVLAPEKGWLYKPPRTIFSPSESQFRPLTSEAGKKIKQIEDDFLLRVKKSDFLYVVDPGGYVGNSACLEIGFAVANGIPVFLQEKINPLLVEGNGVWEEIKSKVKVFSLKEAINQIKTSRRS